MATKLNIQEDEAYNGIVIGFASPFELIIQTYGGVVTARNWPTNPVIPKIGYRVVIKPYPQAGFNLILGYIPLSADAGDDIVPI